MQGGLAVEGDPEQLNGDFVQSDSFSVRLRADGVCQLPTSTSLWLGILSVCVSAVVRYPPADRGNRGLAIACISTARGIVRPDRFMRRTRTQTDELPLPLPCEVFLAGRCYGGLRNQLLKFPGWLHVVQNLSPQLQLLIVAMIET